MAEPARVERLRGRLLQVRNARHLRREPLCRHCRAKGVIEAAIEVDHIIPLAKGGPDNETNLQSLCGPCHEKKTAADFGKTFWPRIGPDGWPQANEKRRRRK